MIVPSICLAISQMLGCPASSAQASTQLQPQSAPAQAGDSHVPTSLAQSLTNLADEPPTHMGFVFDRARLQAIRTLMQSADPESSRAAASISSVSVDNYRYSLPAAYNLQSLVAIKGSFDAAGWKHLVASRAPRQSGQSDQSSSVGPQATDFGPSAAPLDTYGQPRTTALRPRPTIDLWLHFTRADIDGVVVMTRSQRDMSVVQIACDLRPIDLLHLGGHFGIPKVDPNVVMVPDLSQK